MTVDVQHLRVAQDQIDRRQELRSQRRGGNLGIRIGVNIVLYPLTH